MKLFFVKYQDEFMEYSKNWTHTTVIVAANTVSEAISKVVIQLNKQSADIVEVTSTTMKLISLNEITL